MQGTGMPKLESSPPWQGGVSHGYSGTRTYVAWVNMRARCRGNGNRWYGGIGIRVCERWDSSFLNFLADMGECPEGYQISRKDHGCNYEPWNCEWVPGPVNIAERNRRIPGGAPQNLIPGRGRGRSCKPGCECGRHRN